MELTVTQCLIPDGVVAEESPLDRDRLSIIVIATIIPSRLFGSKSIPNL